MANPLFNALGGNNIPNPFSEIIRQAEEIQKTFQGNPREEVQKLLNSGAMSQSQFNALSQQAQQIMQFMGKK
jgi:hypothetical protein